MDRHDEARLVFEKGRNYARLSYIGIFIPILGLVFGLIGLSKLKELVPNTNSDFNELTAAKIHAHWGIGLSVASVFVSIMFIFNSRIGY